MSSSESGRTSTRATSVEDVHASSSDVSDNSSTSSATSEHLSELDNSVCVDLETMANSPQNHDVSSFQPMKLSTSFSPIQGDLDFSENTSLDLQGIGATEFGELL